MPGKNLPSVSVADQFTHEVSQLFEDDAYVSKAQLTDFLKEGGYAVIRYVTAAQREALEQFVTTELFPYVNEQQMYFI